ncbi:MAG: GNAT family N-acetyltransferase [Thermoplasmata archaeon]|nr:GNAT family N-acetyltransferase [Thermoplasmata archaeon]
MRIRELQWEDFHPLVENYLALYEEVKEHPDLGISLFPHPPTVLEETEWFARVFKSAHSGSGVAVVAEENGRAVGLCDVQPKGPQETRHVGVLGIVVARGQRGRGIGRALMQGAIDRCRGKFELVELSVFENNLPARRLYESMGFRTWGTLPKGVKRNDRYINLVFMVSELK